MVSLLPPSGEGSHSALLLEYMAVNFLLECSHPSNATEQPGGMNEPQHCQEQPDDAYHRAQALTTRKGFLHHQHPGQHRHPYQASHPKTKHNEHQCPTAAQAEHPMTQAETPGCSHSLAVVAYAETQWATTLLEAAFLEWSELEDTCNC